MGCCSIVRIKDFIVVEKIGNEENVYQRYLIRSMNGNEEYIYKKIDMAALKKDEKKKINNELNFLKKINHPNIMLLKDAYYSPENKNILNLISEYSDDGDLFSEYIKHKEKKEFFEENTLLNWLMQICLALRFIHENDYIHRDIKPSSIYLINQNLAKLGDFGVSKHLTSPLKHTKTHVSTPQYSAPEIINNNPYSFKSDIWSLGVTFYQLIILDYPFEGTNEEEISQNIVNGNIKEIPKDYNYNLHFIKLIKSMLLNKPDERPSAQEILEKGIVKSRMEAYLTENNFDNSEVQKTIKEYEKNEDKASIKYNVFETFDENNISEETRKKSKEEREKRANYDFKRQMTLMENILHTINTI